MNKQQSEEGYIPFVLHPEFSGLVASLSVFKQTRQALIGQHNTASCNTFANKRHNSGWFCSWVTTVNNQICPTPLRSMNIVCVGGRM